jgi:hypothetical protein
MTEHDDLMDDLRRARPADLPDEVVSPHAPAAQALLEEILSMPTTQPPEVQPSETRPPDTAGDATVTRLTPPRWKRRALAAGAAAAVAVAVVVTTDVRRDPVAPSDATTMETALATSADALGRSGRAEERYEARFINPDGSEAFVESTVTTWEYAGDDSQAFLHPPHYNGVPIDPPWGDQVPINRYVDGELYLYISGRDDTTLQWFRDVGGNGYDTGRLGIDPAALLDRLQSAGDFDEVGTETIDGVTTRRLRAQHPEEAPELRQGMDQLGEVTELEVWVDGDDLVRRVDFTYEGDGTVEPPDTVDISDASMSFRFFDFGEPITIEAPTAFVDFDPVG